MFPITNAVENKRNTRTYPGSNEKFKYCRNKFGQNNTHPNHTKNRYHYFVFNIIKLSQHLNNMNYGNSSNCNFRGPYFMSYPLTKEKILQLNDIHGNIPTSQLKMRPHVNSLEGPVDHEYNSSTSTHYSTH